MWYIYKIINIITNKEYIGQRKLRKNKTPDKDGYMGSGSYIKKSILKYGIENFHKEIIKNNINCQTSANLYEIFYIKEFNTITPNGYNLTEGGSSISGYHHTNDTKEKMSKASKGKKKSIEHTLKNSQSHKGQIITDATKDKISKKLKGILKSPLSDETKQKISKKLTGTKLTNETKEKIKNSSLGRKVTKETREKISNALKGKPKTIEHINSARNGRIYTELSIDQKNKISNSLKKFNIENINKKILGKQVEIHNIVTNEKIIFKSQKLCSEFFNLDFRTVRKYILNKKILKNYLITII